jgi:RNA polymerase sigma factor (sigma-70 family)
VTIGASTAGVALERAFAEHGRFVWGLCYRLTGCAADADDLVQETFQRALERPPERMDEPLRPWLVRVAMNLGRDLLRRRRRRAYVGPWLPSPIETGEEDVSPSFEPELAAGVTTEGRYDLLESVSFAFLIALEALTPQQRAVLVLRDVFDYSVRQTADALGISEPSVKVTLHRARRAMQGYDRARSVPTRALQEQTREALTRFMGALARGDTGAVEALLADGVRAVSDGGGEFFAARVPILGRVRVARFHLNIAGRRSAAARFEVRHVNGLPALVVIFDDGRTQEPPRMVLRCDIDGEGRISAVHVVLATRKLTAVHFRS